MRTSTFLRSIAAVSLLATTSCIYPYTPNDAGDGAWVEQVVPALLGRKPINAVESRVLVDLARQKGREAVVDVLTSTSDFDAYWSIVLADMVKLQRAGLIPQLQSYWGGSGWVDCWNDHPLYPTFGANQSALADALATQIDPRQPAGLGAFSMGDVLRSSIARDDLFAPWRAQLFSLSHFGPSHTAETKTVFLRGFVNRQSECLHCHTSTVSAVPISPIPLNLDGALFPGTNPADRVAAADRVAGAFSGTTASSVFGRTVTSCLSLPSSSHPTAHDPATPGPEFAGLTPATGGAYDVSDLDAALMAGRGTLASQDIGAGVGDPQTPAHVFPDVPIDGDRAFAAALALSTVEAVIKEVEGHGLTLPHGHARVDEQRHYLQAYAYALVRMDWSLRYLLKSLVLRGTFNMVPPNQAPAAYPFPMFFNGWAKNDTGDARNVNSQGDLVHRYSIPALLTAAHQSLGWPAPKVNPASAGPSTPDFASTELHRELGRHESVTVAGRSDVDFQGILAWERTVGMCQNPGPSPDWVDQVLSAVTAPHAPSYTLRDVIVAFKDRLIQDQTIGESTLPTGGTPEEPGPSTDPGPERRAGGYDPSWDDPKALMTRMEQETQNAGLRKKQRDTARAKAAEFAPPEGEGDPGEGGGEEGFRERFDRYTEQLQDPTWADKWIAARDVVDEPGATALLDGYGRQKGYWKSHLPDTEADLLAEYFGVSSIDFPAAQIADLAGKLRGYCGTLLTSPQFMLGGIRPAQANADPVPSLLVCMPGSPTGVFAPTSAQSVSCDEHALCQRYAALAAAHGYGTVTCPP